MDRNGKFTNGLNGLGETYNGQDEAEVELAFQVHRAEPGDLGQLNLLVERYGMEVSRLANALLTLPFYATTDETLIETLVVRTFAYAIRHVERFRGKSSLRNWLFGITIHQASLVLKGAHTPGSNVQPDEADAETPYQAEWVGFDSLSEKYRLVLLLRYLAGLEIEDIRETLNTRPKQAHGWLVGGRRKLMEVPVQSHRSDELEAYVDGLLMDDLTKRDDLESHLPECEVCNTYLLKLRELDERLRNELQARWPLPALDSQDFERLAQMVRQSLSEKRKGLSFALPLKQTAWMVGLLALFAVTAGYFILQQPDIPVLTSRSTSTPTVVPVVEAVQLPNKPEDNPSPGLGSYVAVTAGLSGDADTMAFRTISYDENALETSSQGLYLYDRKSETVLEISNYQETLETTNWIYSLPSLSADGRFVAFSQTSDPQRTPQADICKLTDGTICSDIFVYDRQGGGTVQITHGLNGEAANGISLTPVLSPDGRWVAFWSYASNLTDDDTDPCTGDTGSLQCLDIFLYDRQEDKMIHIPVGSSFPGDNLGADRISISADGSLVGFAIQSGDRLARELQLSSLPQAVLYVRESGAYELINRAPDGSLGNNISFSPVLSDDGRTVAFASLASNLVEGDTNEAVDVFVLERDQNTLERVSVDALGAQANGDSGVLISQMGFYSLDLSADGSTVLFLSLATSLGGSVACNTSESDVCNALILYDRKNGTPEVIQPAENGKLFLFPQISGDGRWVSYMDIFMDCTTNQGLCMRTMLYDRQRGWLNPVSQAIFGLAQDVWKPDEPITAPEADVNIVTVSQNGKYLAAAIGGQSVGIWDFGLNRWIETLQIKSKGTISSLAFDPAGEWLAAGTTDGVVDIWEVSGRNLYDLTDHPGRVHTVVFSPDGEELFAGTPNDVWVWRRGEGEVVQAYKLEYAQPINRIALSPSGNLLAVASSDQSVWLQLLPAGSLISRLGGPESAISDVAFSLDGSLLAFRSLSGEVNLWQVDWKGFGALNTEFVTTINGTDWYGNLVFSPDGKFLASSSFYEGIKLWDIQNNQLSFMVTSDSNPAGVKSIAFTPDGSTLLSGSYGELEVWRTHKSVAEPRYFTRATAEDSTSLTTQTTPPANDWPRLLQYYVDSSSHLNLYQANEMLSFDLLVPTSLPAYMHFSEANLLLDGGALLRYTVDNSDGTLSDFYILERPLPTSDARTRVGAQAHVEAVEATSLYAEYVQGDWREDPENGSGQGWLWDDTLPVQRLRWHEQNLSVVFYYAGASTANQAEPVSVLGSPELVGVWQPERRLGKEELTKIAQGMQVLPAYLSNSTTFITYQVQEGDTCSGLASYYGSSVEAIASLNGLETDCSLIRIGDALLISLNSQRLSVSNADLDCDGQEERLLVFPDKESLDPDRARAIYLSDISDMGLYRDVWQIDVNDLGADAFSYPQWIDFGDCQGLVAFQVFKDDKVGLRLYRWAEDEMQLVLEKGVSLMAVDVESDTLTLREQVNDVASSACQIWNVTYQWDGAQFVELERVADPVGGICQ